jgi:hypothetical protein
VQCDIPFHAGHQEDAGSIAEWVIRVSHVSCSSGGLLRRARSLGHAETEGGHVRTRRV